MTVTTSKRLLQHTAESIGTIGAGLVYACALKYFVFPAKVILTGFEGLAAATAYFFEIEWLFLVLYGIAQAILIAFAFAKISRTFAFRTMLTVAAVIIGLSFLPQLEFASPESQNERILLVLFGGILAGLAKAAALRLRGSTGDEDILAAYFAMKYLKPVGTIGIIAATVSTAYGLTLDYVRTETIEPVINTLMYTSIYIFTSAETLNNFFRKFKLVVLTAVTQDTKALGEAILEAAPHRTFTVQQASGGYSSQSMELVRTIVTHEELQDVLDAIDLRTPDALWYHHDIEGISSHYHFKPIG